jgi:hypothetical protein
MIHVYSTTTPNFVMVDSTMTPGFIAELREVSFMPLCQNKIFHQDSEITGANYDDWENFLEG